MNQDKPHNAIEIFLQPGDLYFGDRETRIRTVLGSCVSLVFWHPLRHVGGMCHYMLPRRTQRRGWELDGRYADEAVALMFGEMSKVGTQPVDYQVKMFGGANMFPDQFDHNRNLVGARNVDMAREIVRAHGLACVCEHLAGAGHRNVVFDVWSGRVWVKHEPVMRPVEMAAGNERIACAA
ncbi:MAG: chemotaxis protein CheD [Sulfuritalea sp.]|jgi:chemotaxis protein CheD|nr:chemotaxis protein CheD [Sulfuritalea sp.]